jgi:hypothetical protein
MPYASVDDVAARLGRPITTDSETAQVNAWLSDIELIIRARIPGLDDLVTAGNPSEQAVVMVESNAVIRKIQNPEGKASERIDDYYYQLDANRAQGDLYLTDVEWDLLTPDTGSGGAFTITPYGAPDTRDDGTWITPTTWVPDP